MRRLAAFVVAALAVTACGSIQASPPGPSDPAGSASVESSAIPTASSSSVPVGSQVPSPSPSDGWPAGGLPLGSRFQVAMLGDGTFLAYGGDECIPGPAVAGDERVLLYDPGGARWVEVPSLNKPRKGGALVALPDGTAMVLGGVNAQDVPFSSTKIFSPTTRSWTNGPLMTVARPAPVAVALADGRVLVADGWGDALSAEIWDPAGIDPSWSPIRLPPGLRGITSMVALPDGRVMVAAYPAGVIDVPPSWNLFDPRPGTWQAALADQGSVIVAMRSGKVLAIGGDDGGILGGGIGASVASVSEFDPGTLTWTEVAPLSIARAWPQVTVLNDDRVLVAGGVRVTPSENGPPASEFLRTTEIFDPSSRTWTRGPDLAVPRVHGRAVTAPDGSVLLLGGDADPNVGDTPFCPAPMSSVERLGLGS